MTIRNNNLSMGRRKFLKISAAGAAGLLAPRVGSGRLRGDHAQDEPELNPVFWINEIPDDPYAFPSHPHHHAGLEALIALMGWKGLKFYKSSSTSLLAGPDGLIGPEDVVLVKVNAQWKHRGATNTDLVRGLIQRLLDQPEGFRGEVVIFENGQGRGSLACDNRAAYEDGAVHANANDERQSFLNLVETVFNDPRVSAVLFDGFSSDFITAADHVRNGYRRLDRISYPCFTTRGGRRVELKEGVWNGSGHDRNLKWINVPVLKHHDTGGSEITASLKHTYGVLSMSDGFSGERHYRNLGEVCGKMFTLVRAPVLNILDCIWVSHGSLGGYPESTTFRANQIMASQDPVALDTCGARHVLYPVDHNERHHPDHQGIDAWLAQARDAINSRGGLADEKYGIRIGPVTRDESQIALVTDSAQRFIDEGPLPGTGERPTPRGKNAPRPR